MIGLIFIAIPVIWWLVFLNARPGGWVRKVMLYGPLVFSLIAVGGPLAYYFWRNTIPEGVIAECGVMRNSRGQRVEAFLQRLPDDRMSVEDVTRYAREVPWPTDTSFTLRILEVEGDTGQLIFEYTDPATDEVFRTRQAPARHNSYGFIEVDDIFYHPVAGIAAWTLPGGIFHIISHDQELTQAEVDYFETLYGPAMVDGEASHWEVAQLAFAEGRYAFYSICRGTLEGEWFERYRSGR